VLMRSMVLRSSDCHAEKQVHRIPLGRTPANSDLAFSHVDERPDDGLVSHAVPTVLNRAKLLNGHVNAPEPAYATLLLKSATHRKMVGDKFERSDIYIRVDAYGHVPAGAGDACRGF